LGKKNIDMVIFYYDFQTKKREKIEFSFKQEINSRTFKQMIEFSKFLTIPDLYKSNFREYCQHDEGRSSIEE